MITFAGLNNERRICRKKEVPERRSAGRVSEKIKKIGLPQNNTSDPAFIGYSSLK